MTYFQRWKYGIRVVGFLVGAILILFLLNTAYEFLSTLDRLKLVEAERDQWQRPADVLSALDLRPGSVVADIGSGAGYFTLKLAPLVGSSGKVIAVDVRKLSLLFLKTRALFRREHNVEVIVGEQDDPHLPDARLDAVLICNTYHEFRSQRGMLDHTFKALRAVGRVVIVDREHRTVNGEPDPSTAHNHEISEASVESELRQRGFEILSREKSFIDRPGDDLWWLVVARKP